MRVFLLGDDTSKPESYCWDACVPADEALSRLAVDYFAWEIKNRSGAYDSSVWSRHLQA